MARKDPDKYVGRWRETPFEPIELPFTLESFAQLLRAACDDVGCYSHQQIADWSQRFWFHVEEGPLRESASAELRSASEIGLEIDARWDTFLLDAFSLVELQALDFSTVRLPREWFRDWLRRLERPLAG